MRQNNETALTLKKANGLYIVTLLHETNMQSKNTLNRSRI